MSFWQKCLHPTQARNKNISSVALEKKNPKTNKAKTNQSTQHTIKQMKTLSSS